MKGIASHHLARSLFVPAKQGSTITATFWFANLVTCLYYRTNAAERYLKKLQRRTMDRYLNLSYACF